MTRNSIYDVFEIQFELLLLHEKVVDLLVSAWKNILRLWEQRSSKNFASIWKWVNTFIALHSAKNNFFDFYTSGA